MLTALQLATLEVLAPVGLDTEQVQHALASRRPGHVLTWAGTLDALGKLAQLGLILPPEEGLPRWTLSPAGVEVLHVATKPTISPLEADLLLELDKAQEGTEGPVATLKRLTRDAAETATLRAQVTSLEAALDEALDEFDCAIAFDDQARGTLARLRAQLPAKEPA